MNETPEQPVTTDTPPRIPDYRLLRRLGKGGMGEVYLAEETQLGRQVAVKFITDEFASMPGTASRERFKREARAMARNAHPHLVRVHSMGEADGRVYMVMEYVEGQNLAQRLGSHGRLEVREALEIVRGVVDGLAAAWGDLIVHRDIKPANLLFDHHGSVKVADFGLAKPAQNSRELRLTRAGDFIGSPHYMSPEQVQGKELSFQSDVYSLGVVLYEILVGKPPFEGDSALTIATQHLTATLPDPSELYPDIPGGVVGLFRWMTHRDPARRPESYELLRQQVDRLLMEPDATRILSAPENPASAEPRRAAGRRSILALAVLLASIAGSGLFGWLLTRSETPTSEPPRSVTPAPVSEPDPISITSFPPGVSLIHANREIGQTPLEIAPFETAVELSLERSGYELATLSWKPGENRLFTRLRPLPLTVESTAAPEALAAAVARLGTTSFGIELSPDPDGSLIASFERAAHLIPLILSSRGDLYRMHEAARPTPGRRTILPQPTAATTLPAGGWALLIATEEPLEEPLILGARPKPGRYTLYPRQVGNTSPAFPAHDYLVWLVESIRAATGDWDVATLRLHGTSIRTVESAELE